jgi:hypothetical protein
LQRNIRFLGKIFFLHTQIKGFLREIRGLFFKREAKEKQGCGKDKWNLQSTTESIF